MGSANITGGKSLIRAFKAGEFQDLDILLVQEHRQGYVENWAKKVEGWGWKVLAAPAVKTKLGGFSGGVAILWRKWVKVSSVQADMNWGPFLRGRAIRAIWHSRWGPVGLTSVYGVVNNIADNMGLLNTVLKDSLSMGCQVTVGGDFNTCFAALRDGVGAVCSGFTHLDFGPTCFSTGAAASHIDFMVVSKDLG